MKLLLWFATASLAVSSLCAGDDTVGLSLLFQNGQAAPIKLVGSHDRYLQEVDIVVTSPSSAADQGILPIQQSGEFSGLDWNGIQMVEEDWRADGTGTFTRQRFYRGARWMRDASFFLVWPLNATNFPVGLPLYAFSGFDETHTILDDGFVRRFVARNIATGCPAVNDCTGASFVAQALVQGRHNVRPERRAIRIPSSATKLCLIWSQQPTQCRNVAVTHHSAGSFPYGYGFVPSLETTNAPANGQFYQPGEPLTLRVTLRDGSGNRLHPVGSLPTLSDVVNGVDQSGIRYYNPALVPTLYNAFKHREANTTAGLLGPVDKVKVSNRVVQVTDFFLPQVVTAVTSDDGWTGLGISSRFLAMPKRGLTWLRSRVAASLVAKH